jgi:hypothetical protein
VFVGDIAGDCVGVGVGMDIGVYGQRDGRILTSSAPAQLSPRNAFGMLSLR